MDPYMIYVSDCGVLIAACPDDKTLVRAGSDGGVGVVIQLVLRPKFMELS
jgi:hypothetical protein